MEITIAKNAGFCFGVSRAVRLVDERIAQKTPETVIYTLGHLIHNPHIIARLEAQGACAIEESELDGIFAAAGPKRPTVVVIRTHGIKRELSERLSRYAEEKPDFEVVDCTCPYVKKIHRIVSEHADKPLLVFGDPDHPEVQGIVSYGREGAFVASRAAELESYLRMQPELQDAVLVSQTTQKLTEWKFSQNIVRNLCTNAKIYDTICGVTEERQNAAALLAKQVDAMVVIGGKESSNTAKLYQTAKNACRATYFIESPEQARRLPITPTMKVGITAGASTPCGLIQEVKQIMTDMEITTVGAADTEDFAGMLEESFKTLNTGEIVRGTILSITAGELQVDLGTKVTGIIPMDEITLDPQTKLTDAYKVGDEIEAKVIKVSDRDGVATLSKKSLDGLAKWREITDAYEAGTVLEGTVTEAVKGGVVMNYSGIRLFIPASQSGIPKEGDLNVLTGTTVKVKLIDLDDKRRRAVASIRAVQREERKAREAIFWDEIENGKEYDGVVKSMTSYGAFVDLGGVDGMVHSSELSWKHIKHPGEVVSLGQTIHVFVKSFDKEARRISLGYKTEESNPWNVFRAKYAVGDVASVKIVSMMPFGAFAEVVPGADGLIHISQIADHKLTKPEDALALDQVVDAKIIDIDEENHKISLSIRALLEEQDEAEDEE